MVDNFTHTYLAFVGLGGTNDNTNEFRDFDVHYNLQVSAAPASGHFNDVPVSNIFYQYIEALAASGITGGCSANNYCPNQYVTRGQMAKFLSIALGLHWPL